MTAPWLVIILAILLLLVYLLRRWQVGGWLAIVVCLYLAGMVWVLPRDQVWLGMGWPLYLDSITVMGMTLLALMTACLFGVSLCISQGWSFYPLGLLILILCFVALLSRQMALSALIVELAVLLGVFIIQGGRTGSIRGALRFLVMMTLSLPLLLIAAWQLTQHQLNQTTLPYFSQIALLLGGGFGVWLGVAPFHGWLIRVATEAKAGISAFILIIFPSVVLVMWLHLFERYPWLADISLLEQGIVMAGLFTVLIGGVWAGLQRSLGALMGYVALFDLGIILIGLGSYTQQGRVVVLLAILVRALALTLLAASTSALERQGGQLSLSQPMSSATSRWGELIPIVGLMVGGLTLAGAPFTLGFVSRWLLLQMLVETGLPWSGLILIGSLGITIGYLRNLRPLFSGVEPSSSFAVPNHWGLNGLISGLAILCLGFGLFPQPLLAIIVSLAQTI